MSEPPASDFEKTPHERHPGLVREFAAFLAYNKKWWLLPILLSLLLLGTLIFLSGTAAAPFIYTLF